MGSTVLATFAVLKNHVKWKISPDDVSIDNIIFKLHYRATFLLLLAGSILVTSRQFFGEHISCIADAGVEKYVIDTFCFFTSTFTVVKHLNLTLVEEGEVPHPGVGPMSKKDEVIHHAYYQWVPFVLFFQAIFFYLPHYLWRSAEGGRLKMLVTGLHSASLSLQDEKIEVNGITIPSRGDRDEKIRQIRIGFLNRLHINRPWAYYLAFYEVLNFINVLFQFYYIDWFLGGSFFNLGFNVQESGFNNKMDPLDEVFPKVTKCIFHKYGPSGTIQRHDALCVMALNIVNEKIYLFLWYWLIFLAILTAFGLIYRILTVILHARSIQFNKLVFTMACPGKYNPWNMLRVTHNYHFGDWLFLYYIAKNLDNYVFKEVLCQLAEDFEERSQLKYNIVPSEDFDTLKKK